MHIYKYRNRYRLDIDPSKILLEISSFYACLEIAYVKAGLLLLLSVF